MKVVSQPRIFTTEKGEGRDEGERREKGGFGTEKGARRDACQKTEKGGCRLCKREKGRMKKIEGRRGLQ